MESIADRAYDYIVVGGGSAGCVVAGRLSDDPTASVLMLEAGRDDTSPFVHIPAGVAKLTADRYEWGFLTEPQRHCAGQRLPYSQGKVVGGGGSINAQVFTRGVSIDFDRWVSDYGCAGWDNATVQEVYRRFERNQRLSAPYHGIDGPLGVSDPIDPSPLSLAWIKAGQEAGLPFNADFNGADAHGIGLLQSTTWNGFRASTSTAYLRHARKRPNLTVRTRVLVAKVVVDGGRAVGVDILDQGRRVRLTANREVIVTAGAIGTPHILQLSGIGNPEWLHRAGIPVVHALPGVGKNFQDHPRVDLAYGIRPGSSMDRYKKLIPGALAAFQYAAFRKGPLASTLAEAGAYAFVDRDAPAPDQQIHFVPAVHNEMARMAGLETGHGVMIDAYALRPTSRGSVVTASADPTKPPLIDPNFLETEYDLHQVIGGTKIMRDIMSQPSMAKIVTSEYLYEFDELVTDADYTAFVKAHITSACHPTSTCAMGTGDDAVVAPDTLKVYGLEGLRVADASVMPAVVSANTQAPTVMVAERAVDFIQSGA